MLGHTGVNTKNEFLRSLKESRNQEPKWDQIYKRDGICTYHLVL